MLHYKTQAIKRLEAFFEANYQKMYGIAVKEVGEHRAWDAVNDTYISLMRKEERGRGHMTRVTVHAMTLMYTGHFTAHLKACVKHPLR